MKQDNFKIDSFRPVIIGESSPPVLACIRSWGRQGMSAGLVNVAASAREMLKSKYLVDSVSLPPSLLYTDAGLRIICSFLEDFQASGLLCISEKISCWINDSRDWFPARVAVWLPPNRIINRVLSKKKQLEVAADVGFDVLPTYYINSITEPLPEIDAGHFPLCLRPSQPGTVTPSFKVLLLTSESELKQFFGSISELRQPIIAQPFCSLPNLVVHGARTIDGDNLGVRGFMVERKFEGVTLTIRPFEIAAELRRKCIVFADASRLIGPYHFEFLYDRQSGKFFYLEINNRLGGTTAKVYTCGYDEPILALRSYGVPVVPELSKLKNITVSSKRALLKYMFYSFRGRLTPLDYPAEAAFLRVAAALKGLIIYSDDVLSFNDIAGSYSVFSGTLFGFLQRNH